ncbi:hypothetical protein F5Y14DRAFT_227573 [Nemania sp. NC0429]|nr:hypothetical protein F5Y14DRAFT_227573 [Nemania sp. NC0429]
MQLDTFTTRLMIFCAVQSTSALPLHRRPAPSRPLDNNGSCEFYGYVGKDGMYNNYTIDTAGWSNAGSLDACPDYVSKDVQNECGSELENFICKIHENQEDLQITFHIGHDAVFQPDCVTEGLRRASNKAQHEQNIQCFCLAECW